MRAGRLKHKVVFQTRTETRDAHGGVSTAWGTAFKDFIAIEPVRSKEQLAAGQINTETTHTGVMRYRSGVTTGHRILWGSRIFDINAVVNPCERGRALELLLKEDV